MGYPMGGVPRGPFAPPGRTLDGIMAWTAADRDAVKTSILALATGTREVSLTFNGRTTIYQPADLATLRETLALIEAELGATADLPRPRAWFLGGGKSVE